MNFDLRKDALSRTLVCAHRGVSGGNIHCNTLEAFEAALKQGADMIELDVASSKDGQLFIFHPGMERAHLHSDQALCDLTAEEIGALRYYNGDNVITSQRVTPFDEAMERLKGRCYINIDKYWENIEPITKAIRRHGMERQVLVKAAPSEETFALMEKLAPDIPFMIILRDRDEYSDKLLKRQLNFVGVEVLFEKDTAELATRAYVEKMHQKGLIVWANSIVYNEQDVISGGHNDDISVAGDPQAGWGWIIQTGYDIIQTDWPQMLHAYMAGRAK